MKFILTFFLAVALASCASSSPSLAQADVNGDGVISPAEDAQFKQQTVPSTGMGGTGSVTNTIRNTASTVGIVRNLQTIFAGF